MDAIPAAMLLIFGLAVGFGLLGFWVWMLVDCVNNEPSEGNDKLVWVAIILIAQLLGAAIYYFVRYRPRATSLEVAI